jgi:phosphomannomutase
MKLLKIGLSGVRGIVGDSMTPKLAMDFAAAFGTFIHGGTVLVGRDTRVSGPMLQAACVSALSAAGCDVLDMGVCPTPVLQWAVRHRKARGGVSITAGHNDIQWNALTFLNREGTYLNPFQGAEVLDLYHLARFRKVSVDGLGSVTPGVGDAGEYFRALARFIDIEAVRGARLKVVIDACNGAGSPYLTRLAEALGFELVPVNDAPNGFFPHDPEPRPRNAQQVVSVLKVVDARAGFLLNSDVSRVSLVSETGESLSEEFTFPLVANAWLEKHRGPVVTNLSTSRMIEDVARVRGCPIVRTKVGQSHAIHTLLQEEGVLAGEGSGGVAVPAFQPAFDGFLTIGLVLETMARRSMTLSGLAGELPRYHIVKEKLYCPPARVHSVVSEVRKFFRRHEVDTSDGIRVEDEHGWILVRTSATEPMIRVIAEDGSSARARARADEVISFINPLTQ